MEKMLILVNNSQKYILISCLQKRLFGVVALLPVVHLYSFMCGEK